MKHKLLLSLADTFLVDEVEDTMSLYQFCFDDNFGTLLNAADDDRECNTFPKRLSMETWIVEYDNFHFFQLFRMEKSTVEKLITAVGQIDVNKILSKNYTGGHYPIDMKCHVLIFLWYMATQDTLLSIATRFKISPASVMNVVNKMLYFVVKLKKSYIKFPVTEEELADVSEGFKNYPGVVGAIDGTHIFIKVENEQQDSYIDRYRRHSINIMAICESNRLFTYVFVGFPGSAHDSRVFENSQFFREIEKYGPNRIFHDDKKYHLIGDSAFGLKTWLMTPYRDNNQLNRKEKRHNWCLSSERVVIEHAFGQLKGRWRRLQYINTYNICKTIEISTAACVLHNFCILNTDTWTGNMNDDEDQAVPAAIVEQRDNQEGKIKRNQISNNL